MVICIVNHNALSEEQEDSDGWSLIIDIVEVSVSSLLKMGQAERLHTANGSSNLRTINTAPPICGLAPALEEESGNAHDEHLLHSNQ